MKTQKMLVLMLFGPFLMTLLLACQKQEHSANLLRASDDRVEARSDECDDCVTQQDCCCWVELNDDDAATIQLCGTTSGDSECSISNNGNCSGSVDGTLEVVSLGTFQSGHVFCMDQATAIRIINLSPSDDAGIRVSCSTSALPIQYDISPQDSVFAETNISCVLSDCS